VAAGARPGLPLPIPEPLGLGQPSGSFPWPWSIRRWLPGDPATPERVTDVDAFAADLARFLTALHDTDPCGGPGPGAHNFGRGGPLSVYDSETRPLIAALPTPAARARATAIWEQALASEWDRPPVWVHGDMTPSNLLVDRGRLVAVIDFGGCAVGDPACDLVIAWTALTATSRSVFRAGVELDERTWQRARGWALWKALVTLDDTPEAVEASRRRFAWRWPVSEVVERILDPDP
jgi:aminoglycoside phosphotransferase (APT) family kinase protein